MAEQHRGDRRNGGRHPKTPTPQYITAGIGGSAMAGIGMVLS
ncbi:MAG: hypothetical protein AB1925_13640 [Actinomycetota bacterium]